MYSLHDCSFTTNVLSFAGVVNKASSDGLKALLECFDDNKVIEFNSIMKRGVG